MWAKWYRERTSEVLNELIGEQPVLDLRAGAYKSFYVPRGQIIECAFLKGGRSVNHWSKAYRGLVARRFAPGAARDGWGGDRDGDRRVATD